MLRLNQMTPFRIKSEEVCRKMARLTSLVLVFLPAIGYTIGRYDLFSRSRANLSLLKFITRVPIPGSALSTDTSARMPKKERR